MNPDIIAIMQASLERGHDALVLTNAMRPMMKCAEKLLALKTRHGARLTSGCRSIITARTCTRSSVARGPGDQP